MGYKKIITYILESESGVSHRASNFLFENEYCGGKVWTGKRKNKKQKTPEEMKQRWVKMLYKELQSLFAAFCFIMIFLFTLILFGDNSNGRKII